MKQSLKIKKFTIAAFFIAIGYVMPFLTGQIPEIGSMLCPLHIPVLLCGFICGWPWGMVVGFITPLLRSLTLGMPPLFPTSVCMAFELAAYGLFAGLMHKILPPKKPFIYCSLIISMLLGRIVWGIIMLLLMGLNGSQFGLSVFLASAFTNALPGIIVQIVIIPPLVMILDNPSITGLYKD